MADEQEAGGELTGDEKAIIEGRDEQQEQPQAEEQQQEAAPEGEAAAEQPQEERAKSFVPIGELQRERNRRKEEAAARAKAEQDLQRLAGRLDVLQQTWQQQQKPQEQQQALPPISEAPLDHIESHEQRMARLEQQEQQRQRQQQEMQAQQQFLGTIRGGEQQFRATAPDYDAAIQHLRKDRADELAEAGYTPDQCEQIIDGEAMAIAQSALQQRRNPAEVWYNMAKRRGYRAAQQQNGAEKVEMIDRGQQASRSLSQAGGAAPPGKLTLDALLKMSDEEFGKMAEKDFKAAMGG